MKALDRMLLARKVIHRKRAASLMAKNVADKAAFLYCRIVIPVGNLQ